MRLLWRSDARVHVLDADDPRCRQRRYQKRISGPLLDRIDIHVEVPAVDYEKLSDERLGEPSAAVSIYARNCTICLRPI
jgi:predicted ATPase with chaperone activity